MSYKCRSCCWYFKDNPKTSLRCAADIFNITYISLGSAQIILKKHTCHPYNLKLVQELHAFAWSSWTDLHARTTKNFQKLPRQNFQELHAFAWSSWTSLTSLMWSNYSEHAKFNLSTLNNWCWEMSKYLHLVKLVTKCLIKLFIFLALRS